MRAWAVVLLLGAGVARAQEEPSAEDDPAFARAVSASLQGEEPQPDPVPFTEEDPAYAAAPPAVATSIGAPRPAPRRARHLPPTEVRLRASYRTLRLAEVAPDGQALLRQRFHGVGVDVYPISSRVRLGLSTQLAMEADGDDWVATEGLVIGFQLPRRSFAPFLEGGVHAGLAQRTFWFPDQPMPIDSLTVLWAFSLDLGVDVRLYGSLLGTVSLGLQRTSYFYTSAEENAPLQALHDKAFALKLGIGY